MPEFREVNEKFGDRILLFGLDVGPFTNLGTSKEGQARVQELGVTYPTGTTSNPEVVKVYDYTSHSSRFVILPFLCYTYMILSARRVGIDEKSWHHPRCGIASFSGPIE